MQDVVYPLEPSESSKRGWGVTTMAVIMWCLMHLFVHLLSWVAFAATRWLFLLADYPWQQEVAADVLESLMEHRLPYMIGENDRSIHARRHKLSNLTIASWYCARSSSAWSSRLPFRCVDMISFPAGCGTKFVAHCRRKTATGSE